MPFAIDFDMNRFDYQGRIAARLAQFSSEVAIRQAASYTDLNRAAQSLVAKLLALVFDLPDLRDLDLQDGANFPAIDLGDDGARVAFQVTGDASGSKIKSTFETFAKHNLNGRFDKLRFYILTERQATYTVDLKDVVPTGMLFDLATDVIDKSSLLADIKRLPLDRQREIADLLDDELASDGLASFAMTDPELKDHAAVFVPPAEFKPAKELLQRRGLVILSGPPHIGKSETAVALLRDVSGGGRILRMSARDLLARAKRLSGEFVAVDDPFGEVRFDDDAAGNAIGEILNASTRNRIVLTTRATILENAAKLTRLGERGGWQELQISLNQEGSYSTDDLCVIFERHLERRAVEGGSHSLDSQTAATLRPFARRVVDDLRFPHNLERFITNWESASVDEAAVRAAIWKAKDIVRASRSWFESLPPFAKARIALLVLMPAFDDRVATEVAESTSGQRISLSEFLRLGAGYLTTGYSPRIGHPSYREGVLDALVEDERDLAWHLLDQVAQRLSTPRFRELRALAAAAKQLERAQDWLNDQRPRRDRSLSEYFTRFLNAYNSLTSLDLTSLRPWIQPYADGDARVHAFHAPSGLLLGWSLLPFEDEAFTSSVEEVGADLFPRLTELRGYGSREIIYGGVSHRTAVPEIEAFGLLWKQVTDLVKQGPLDEFGPTLAIAQLYGDLESGGFPVQQISKESPLTSEWLRIWFAQGLEFLKTNRAWPTEKKGFNRFEIVPELGIVNDLRVGVAANLLETLSLEGRSIDGPFFLPSDLDWETVVRKSRRPLSLADVYSDARLCENVRRAITAHYTSIKEAFDVTLLPAGEFIWLKNLYPLSIVCVIDRRIGNDPYDRVRIHCLIRSESSKDAEVLDLELHLVTEATPADEAASMDALVRSAWRDRRGDFVQLGGYELSRALRIDDWLKGMRYDLGLMLESVYRR